MRNGEKTEEKEDEVAEERMRERGTPGYNPREGEGIRNQCLFKINSFFNTSIIGGGCLL